MFILLNCPHETSMSDYCLIGLTPTSTKASAVCVSCIFLLFVFQMHFTPHFRCKSSSSRRSGAKLSYVFIGVNAFLHISDISVKICCSSEYGKQNKLRPQTNLLGEVQWPKNLSFQEFTVGGAGLKLGDRNTRMMETCAFEIFPILWPSFTSYFDAFTFSNETSQCWKDSV